MTALPARSIEEIHFYLELNGLQQTSHAMVMAEGDLVARYVCTDASGATRTLDFEPVSRSLLDVSDGASTTPSRLLDAGQWMEISDRHAKRSGARDLMIATRALEEALLFFPEGGTSGIEPFFTERGRAYRKSQPSGTFERRRLLVRLEMYRVAARPKTAVEDRALVPLLKAADYAHRALCVHMPLPGLPPRSDLPIVTFAENTPNGYILLTQQDAPHADTDALLTEALKRLPIEGRDVTVVAGVAVHGGSDLAAELLLHEGFLRAVMGKALGSQDLLVVAPHRIAIYAIAANAPSGPRAMLAAMIRTELERGPREGNAPVSPLVFRVTNGKIVDALPLSTLGGGGGGAAPTGGGRGPTGGAGSLNWGAGVMGAFFAGVLGMGAGVGIISVFDQMVPSGADGLVVFGSAGMLAALGFVFGLRLGR